MAVVNEYATMSLDQASTNAGDEKQATPEPSQTLNCITQHNPFVYSNHC